MQHNEIICINWDMKHKVSTKFKRIFTSLIVALMVLIIPVQVFALENIDVKESTNERSSRQKRSISTDLEKEKIKRATGFGGASGGRVSPRNIKLTSDSWLKRSGVDAHDLKKSTIGKKVYRVMIYI